MLASVTLVFCRVAIASVFALSAGGKALDVVRFEESVSDFRLLPTGWSKAAAWIFIFLEFVVVLAMVVGGGALPIGFVLALALLAVFSAALGVTLRRGLRVSCNCFGHTERRVSPYDVGRNGVLIACSLVGATTSVSSPPPPSSTIEAVLASLMALCFVVLVINLRDVVKTLFQPFRIG
jgi:hypothetical protein